MGALRSEKIAARGDDASAALERDYARCAEVTRRASSNFYYAFMLLPRGKRRALHAVYAFCRFIDDIADDESVANPSAMLERWREELGNVYAGFPTRPISRALADNVRRYNIPRRHFDEIIDGVEMDLTRRRYETFTELERYCHHVASAVGLICIEIFGYREPSTQIYAEKLGLAFQLTNILRDVREDASRERIYLPLEDLRRFGVKESDILASLRTPEFRALMAFEAGRARALYREAEAALSDADRPAMLAAEGMRVIYSAILDEIVRADYRIFERRISLSSARKLALVARVWGRARLGGGANWTRWRSKQRTSS